MSDELVKRGVEPWLDVRELDGGADWRERVSESIRNAGGFVFIIGKGYPPDGQGLDWQQRFEWQQIVDLDIDLDPSKPLVPVQIAAIMEPGFLHGYELPGFLNSRQIVDLNEEHIDYGKAADRAVHLLRNPAETIDQEKLQRARLSRVQALESLKKYAYTLEEQSVKRSGLREPK